VDPSRVTFTSDGQGSLPVYDSEGRLWASTGRVTSLLAEVRDAISSTAFPWTSRSVLRPGTPRGPSV
jgi:hypothetical protein